MPLSQGEFNFTIPQQIWPHQEFYPLNIEDFDRYVHRTILTDFQASPQYLIITAFTSIEYLVDFYGKYSQQENQKTRVVLGFEPIIRNQRKIWNVRELSDEIINHWLTEGFSVWKCGGVINIIELIDKKRLEFRISNKLHAKIYVGQNHAILGSSNFSYAGLYKSKEANVRFEKNTKEYSNIKQIAENFFETSEDFTKGIKDLLKSLLKVVSWEEALVRAIAELIEGKWIESYPSFQKFSKLEIWPSQREAIGQALWILDNQGSALIADPTGSGKTLTGACLQLSIFNRLWSRSKGEQSNSIVLCPPIVSSNWKKEYEFLEFYNPPIFISHGILSKRSSKKFLESLKGIKKANILIVDEAHNFLNKASNRSKSILESLADNTILFTATPINKKIEDILRIIELLDVDNLSDQALQLYKDLRWKRSLLKPQEQAQIKELVSNFTVRRVKKQLNKMIALDRDKYKNRKGKHCRYPSQKNIEYNTEDDAGDRLKAKEINLLAEKLKGLINLQELKIDDDKLLFKEELEKYTQRRLKIAKELVKYTIQLMLRSSRVALVEHIEGTVAARDEFNIPKSAKKESGDIIKKLIALSNGKPKTNYQTNIDWIDTEEKYRIACEEEIMIYRQISAIAKKISSKREEGKIRKIVELFEKHPLILAFDNRGLTLDYLGEIIRKNHSNYECLVVKGSDEGAKAKAIEYFKLGSSKKNVVALCSDSMSEGVNLQQGSAMVLLDMPSVLRIAEQRIGRLDRMDSPHDEIEIYWPKDSGEFRLRTDLKFFKTHNLVNNLLGANLHFDDGFMDYDFSSIEEVDIESTIKEIRENEAKAWDGIKDAFQSVRELKEGEKCIVKEEDYNKLKYIDATIRCKVSLIKSDSEWAFFAIRGSTQHAPQWLFIDGENNIINELSSICFQLRARLKNVQSLEWTKDSEKAILKQLNFLHANQIKLLPNKKKRSLEILQDLVARYLKMQDLSSDRRKLLNDLNAIFNPHNDEYLAIDYYQFSEKWLSMLQPIIIEMKIKNKKRKGIIDLSFVGRELLNSPLSDEQLSELLNNIPVIEKFEKRIASCIVAMKN
jgi:superfamily II DNA or RNA helicase